ncbi:MAG: TIGR01548 family HAD-type hydrolase [Planctomycetota bacterium]
MISTPSLQPVPALAGVRPYRVPAAGAPVDLRLDANEGPVPSAAILHAIAACNGDSARRYATPALLEAALANQLGVTPDRVLVTAGGDDVLDRACRAVLCPGRSAVLTAPTFEMIPRWAGLSGAHLVVTNWDRGGFPRDEIIASVREDTTMVAVVTPNNPTGAVATAEDIEAISAAAPHALLVVDLAYTEFADDDLTETVLRLPNAIAVRTFSKAWGLAGLRLGYALGPSPILDWLRASGGPYPCSTASLAAGLAAVERGPDRAYIEAARAQRTELRELLTSLGCDAYDSQANFVLARAPDAVWLRDSLAGLGIAIRVYPDKLGLQDAVRISCPGNEADLARLTAALRAALAPEALLLDLDGVIADVSGSYRASIIQTCTAFGVTVDPSDIAAAKAGGNANNDWVLTRSLLAARGVDVSQDEVTDRFEEIYQGVPDRPGLRETETMIPSVDTVRALAERFPLAVVTGRPRRDAEYVLERFGIRDLFRHVVCMEDGPAKPDPTPVSVALDRLGVDRAWMVGDTVDDLRAARAASVGDRAVVPLGVVPPGEKRERSEPVLVASGAGRVLKDLSDLIELAAPEAAVARSTP